ncbi:SLC13 family permease [Salidesulfovibrio brasiliensis]|uniref:SLC13 family permease n=1 Tax=Salidesulfovibrio brasiliensis TaxID=221711 RepID=UPI0006D0FEA0|nr:SLC13 family permease [Salidesulfovibrio brasiliensis]
MNPDVIIVSIILLVAVVLLVSEKLPVDLTGLGIVVVLMVAGQLTPVQAVAGFANPAPLAVGALFVVSRGLVRTGALNFITRTTIKFTAGSRKRLLFVSLILVGTLSAFLNNTPVVILFMSIIIAACSRFGFAPSKLLIPLSYISILAGTCTLIGTSTNILVSDTALSLGAAPIGMFELSVLGVPIAIAGAVFMYFFADYLLPEHASPFGDSDNKAELYLSELKIYPDSLLVGVNPAEGVPNKYESLKIYEVFRGENIYDVNQDQITLQADDRILVKGSADDLTSILENKDAGTPSCSEPHFDCPHLSDTQLVELLIPSGSGVRGVTLNNLYLTDDLEASVIGLLRRHSHYSWREAHSMVLRVGDVLLVQLKPHAFERIRKEEDFIILNDDVVQDLVNRRRAPMAIGIFLLMIAAVASGLTNILIGAFAGAFAMIITGCLSLREAYRSVDVKILMLIIGTIALGLAMQKSGADMVYAKAFLGLFAGAGPQVILAGFIVLTSLLSHFLSNNSTAVLLVPVGMATAAALGVDPRPFIIGIAFGASACFATPIGYQTNLIVYGPGGYTFLDFLRLGLPMVIISCGAASLFIPTFWPF